MVFTGLDKAELIGLEAYMKEKGVKVEREEKEAGKTWWRTLAKAIST